MCNYEELKQNASGEFYWQKFGHRRIFITDREEMIDVYQIKKGKTQDFWSQITSTYWIFWNDMFNKNKAALSFIFK